METQRPGYRSKWSKLGNIPRSLWQGPMAYVALFLALTPVVWILAQHLAAQSLYGELQTISKEAETTSPRISPEEVVSRKWWKFEGGVISG